MLVAIKDEFGRLVNPKFANTELKIAEAPDEIESVVATAVHRPTIGECREFLSQFESGFSEWCDENGIDESGKQSMLLCVLGLMTQRSSDAIRVLRCDPEWCRIRCDRLRGMGLWDGADRLGERFGLWVDENDQAGIQTLLGVMEIEGLIISKVVDGEYVYSLPEKVSE